MHALAMFHPAMKKAAAPLLMRSKMSPALKGAKVIVARSMVLNTALIFANLYASPLKKWSVTVELTSRRTPAVLALTSGCSCLPCNLDDPILFNGNPGSYGGQ